MSGLAAVGLFFGIHTCPNRDSRPRIFQPVEDRRHLIDTRWAEIIHPCVSDVASYCGNFFRAKIRKSWHGFLAVMDIGDD
jgi:hypothetical protein